jgi:O-antigen ligase
MFKQYAPIKASIKVLRWLFLFMFIGTALSRHLPFIFFLGLSIALFLYFVVVEKDYLYKCVFKNLKSLFMALGLCVLTYLFFSYFLTGPRTIESISNILKISSALFAFLIIKSCFQIINKTPLEVIYLRNFITFGIVLGLMFLMVEISSNYYIRRNIIKIASALENQPNLGFVYTHSAVFMVLSFWFSISHFIQEKEFVSTFLIYVCLGIVLVKLGVDAPILSFLVGTVVFLAGYYYPKSTSILLTISFVGMLCLLPIASRISLETTRGRQFISPITHSSGLHRIYMWNYLTHEFEKKPWEGWGIGGVTAFSTNHDLLEVHQELKKTHWPIIRKHKLLASHPHNIFIQWLLELGIIGTCLLAAFVGIIPFLIFKNIQVPILRAGAFAHFASAVVIGALSFNFWHSSFLGILFLSASFWFLRDKRLAQAA